MRGILKNGTGESKGVVKGRRVQGGNLIVYQRIRKGKAGSTYAH